MVQSARVGHDTIPDMTPALPTARTPNPLDAPPLRWGVLAPGRIAAAFVTAVSRYTRQRVKVVGSRSLDRAQAFATAHGIERAVGSYAELVDDPAVDVVYIASPDRKSVV